MFELIVKYPLAYNSWKYERITNCISLDDILIRYLKCTRDVTITQIDRSPWHKPITMEELLTKSR